MYMQQHMNRLAIWSIAGERSEKTHYKTFSMRFFRETFIKSKAISIFSLKGWCNAFS